LIYTVATSTTLLAKRATKIVPIVFYAGAERLLASGERTRSAAIAGSRSYWFSAHRYSIDTSW